MNASKIIKQLLIERNTGIKELAKQFNILPQSMSNKLYRNTLSFDDVVKYCNALDCDVVIVTRDTKKEFKVNVE